MTPEDPQDHALVQALRRGEARAIETLAERYAGRIHRILTSLLADPGDAERVTDDVLRRVLRDIAGYAGSPVFLSWVYRIALQAAREHAPAGRRAALARPRPARRARTRGHAAGPAGRA